MLELSPNFSSLTLVSECTAVSLMACVQQCHTYYSRGCGYHMMTKHCVVYLDWGHSTRWTAQDGYSYFVPLSDNLFSLGWTDLRAVGFPFAVMVSTLLKGQLRKKKWPNARSYCQHHGANLYSMDSERKWEALRALFQYKYITIGKRNQGYWLGLQEISKYNWMWESHEQMESEFWRPGEPNGIFSRLQFGVMYPSLDFEIDDTPRNGNFLFICELPYQLPALPTVQITKIENLFTQALVDMRPLGYPFTIMVSSTQTLNGRQLEVSKYWPKASSYCERYGSKLFSMDSDRKREALRRIFKHKNISQNQGYWLGLKEVSRNNWKWESDQPMKTELWAPGEPNNVHGGLHFGAVYPALDYKIQDSVGNKKFNFICEMVSERSLNLRK